MAQIFTKSIITSTLRKFAMAAVLLVYISTIATGQTAQITHSTAFPGNSTSVQLNVTGFTGVNAITFNIRYNPSVLSFISLSNINPSLTSGSMTAYAVDSTIHVVWYSTSPSTVNGLLCNLNFLYNGTSTVLSFLPTSVVTQGTGTNLLIGYSNGSVSPASCNPGDPAVSLGSAAGIAGGQVMIPLNFNNFPLAGAITQYIHYDASRLNFVSGTKSGNLAGAQVTGGNGLITVVWSNPLGANINTTPTTWLHLNFVCNIPGTTPVTFAPGCVISNPLAANINTCYSNGLITQVPTTNTAVLGSLNSIVQGDDIQIPLDLSISGPVSSFTLYFTFNSPTLVFTGIQTVDPLSSMVTANAVGNQLTMTYTNMTMPAINAGTFLKLKFHYNGVGTGFVNFVGASQFTDQLLQIINVAYTNATVAPGVYPPIATATIGTAPGTVGNFVDIPVELDGAVANPLGAVTMYIGFDNEKLSFVGAIGNTYNASVDALGNQISIAWYASSTAGVNLSGTFITLRFMYNGGGGNGCSTPVYFQNDAATQQACELADNMAAFVPANWVNGGVNLAPATPAINGPANPAFNTTENYSTDGGMINYYWSVTGGTIATGNGTPYISVNWGMPGNGSVSVSYTTPGSCNLSALKPVTIVSGSPTTDLNGYVTYDNMANQGMNGVGLTLFNSLGVQVGSPVVTSTNGTHGFYSFVSVPHDDYTLGVTCSAPWAGTPGVSATDALIVELHTAGVLTPPLSGLRLAAGNVNASGAVNATDALFIKKRIVGDITSFPAGDWVFGNGIIHAFTSPVSIYDFKGLCTGDVNGSYNPVVGVKEGTTPVLTYDMVIPVNVNETFTLDLRTTSETVFGAVTLFLAYNAVEFEIEKVISPVDGMEYRIANGMVAIAWSNPASRKLQPEDKVLSFQVRAKRMLQEPASIFTMVTGSELAGPAGEILNDTDLKLGRVVTNNGNFEVFSYPNPFRTTASVAFTLPTSSNVTASLTDMAGKRITILSDASLEQGNHQITVDPELFDLNPGLYFCTIEAKNQIGQYVKTIKIVYTK